MTALSLAAVLLVSAAISGCAQTTGTVVVQMKPDSTADPAAPVTVTIRDASKKIVAQQSMHFGESASFPGIRFGWVKITAEGICGVGTRLTQTGVRAVFEPHHCSI